MFDFRPIVFWEPTDKFCPGSKNGNKLQGLAPFFSTYALNVLLTWLGWVHGIHAL